MMTLFLFLTSAAHAAEGAGDSGADAIPWGPIAFHAMNLLILLAIIYRFAGKGIRDAVADRATRIRRDIDSSAATHSDALARYQALEERLSRFEAQLSGMRTEAEREAAGEREAILARGEKDAAQILDAAERTIRAEVARARAELRREAIGLAVRIAEQQLSASLKSEDEDRFAQEFLRSVREVPRG